jgi:hypothetical protein
MRRFRAHYRPPLAATAKLIPYLPDFRRTGQAGPLYESFASSARARSSTAAIRFFSAGT